MAYSQTMTGSPQAMYHDPTASGLAAPSHTSQRTSSSSSSNSTGNSTTTSSQSSMGMNGGSRPISSKQRFFSELSQCLFDFVIQLLPTAEEMSVKEDVRKLLERLIRTIEPDSRLLSFGSTANGFSLRNSGVY